MYLIAEIAASVKVAKMMIQKTDDANEQTNLSAFGKLQQIRKRLCDKCRLIESGRRIAVSDGTNH